MISRMRWAHHPALAPRHLSPVSTVVSFILLGLAGCSGGGTDPGNGTSLPPNDLVPGKSYFGRNGSCDYSGGARPVLAPPPRGGTTGAADTPDRASPDTLRDLNPEEPARAMDTAFKIGSTRLNSTPLG